MARSETTVVVICVTVLVSVVVAAVALVYVFAPAGTDTPGLAAILVGTLAPTIAALATMLKVGNVSSQVADVAADTEKLANGLGDAKIRTAVADVLADDLVDPEAREQLAADRAKLYEPEEHA